jgi:hypothetical protein
VSLGAQRRRSRAHRRPGLLLGPPSRATRRAAAWLLSRVPGPRTRRARRRRLSAAPRSRTVVHGPSSGARSMDNAPRQRQHRHAADVDLEAASARWRDVFDPRPLAPALRGGSGGQGPASSSAARARGASVLLISPQGDRPVPLRLRAMAAPADDDASMRGRGCVGFACAPGRLREGATPSRQEAALAERGDEMRSLRLVLSRLAGPSEDEAGVKVGDFRAYECVFRAY